MREIVSAMTGLSVEDLRDQGTKKMELGCLPAFAPDDTKTVRDLLIKTGEFMRQFNDTYFVEKVIDVLLEDEQFIIDDLRFSREMESIKERFGDEVEIILIVNGDERQKINVTPGSIVYKDRYSVKGIIPDSIYVNPNPNAPAPYEGSSQTSMPAVAMPFVPAHAFTTPSQTSSKTSNMTDLAFVSSSKIRQPESPGYTYIDKMSGLAP